MRTFVLAIRWVKEVSETTETVKKIELKVERDLSTIKKDIILIKQDVNLSKQELSKNTQELSKQREMILYHFQKTAASILQLRAGLGESLEKLCASWLRHHLSELKFGNVEVKLRYKIASTSTRREYEVDVISFDPLVILEFTAFVNVKNITKIQNLVDLIQILSNEQKKTPKYVFLVTYGFEKDIEEQCLQIAKNNNIIIINADSIL